MASTLLLFLSITIGNKCVVTAAPTQQQNKQLTEGVCSMKFILKNRYLRSLKDDSNLLTIFLEMHKMAKGMLEEDKKLEELEMNGQNSSDILASRLMIEHVMKDYCYWVNSALNEDINCSNHASVLSFVIQISLLEKLENTCNIIKNYTLGRQDGHVSIKQCAWIFCNLSPKCNPLQTNQELFDSLKNFAPQPCPFYWDFHTCSTCPTYSLLPSITPSYSSPPATSSH
ncbi:PREDICTED: uncharacterized protein LOC109582168 isoform X2 [Amphimedon queenslandica]|uniref:Uncharacterized protein n=1 Tax=Amphimedon queenslandica TaxID=400682 RepID=A0AAN0J5T3_AMPQE|nr:PREDICTED: uncharacterized protein LOC109582168 isoform X2 [Amphimedon queenslandica]|eukprot:XP_019852374.1 PREDICTED: uncharacterized protein LOC109582168 isoform X2 [Amphimedon queenslandica]